MKRLQAIQWSCLGRHRRTSSRDPVSISQGCAVIKDTSEQLWRQGYEQVGRGELGLFAVLAVLLHDHLRSPNTLAHGINGDAVEVVAVVVVPTSSSAERVTYIQDNVTLLDLLEGD